jgi:unsaturated chondroitin disaccharide hydrolase
MANTVHPKFDPKIALDGLVEATAFQLSRMFKHGPFYVGPMNRWTGTFMRFVKPQRCDDAGFLAARTWLCYLASKDPRFREWGTAIVDGVAEAIAQAGDRVHVGADLSYGLCWGANITASEDWARIARKAAQGIVKTHWSDKLGTFVFTLRSGPLIAMEGIAWLTPLALAASHDPSLLSYFIKQFDRTIELGFVREDGGCYQIAELDAGHRFQRFASYQGYAANSTWARGQSWAMLGFLGGWEASGEKRFLDVVLKMTAYWLARTKDDPIPFYDFDDPAAPMLPRDSCAAAMAADVLIRLARAVGPSRQSDTYIAAADRILAELCDNYLSPGGVLLHGSAGHVKTGTIFGAPLSRAPQNNDPHHRTQRFPQEEVMPYGNLFIVSALYRRVYENWTHLDLPRLA